MQRKVIGCGMRWPQVSSFVEFLQLPAGISAQQLGRADLAEWTAALSAWHPDLAIGEESALLQPATYAQDAALRDESVTDDRDMYTLVLWADGEDPTNRTIVAGIVLEYDRDDAAMAGRMSVVSPAWRGRGLGRVLLRAQEAAGRGLGARSEWGLVELDNTPQQHLLESEGNWLCGIVPESDQRRGMAGDARYVPEALYIKPLVSAEDLLWPQREHLVDEVADLFALLQLPGSPSFSADVTSACARPHTSKGALSASASEARPPLPRLSPAAKAQLAGRSPGLWPDIDALLGHPDCDVDLPPGYRLRVQTADDIAMLTGPDGLLGRWHPALLHQTGQALTTAAYHRDHVALGGAQEPRTLAERPCCHLLLCRDSQPVAFCAFSVDAAGVSLFADLGVVDPAHIGRGLMLHMARALLWIAAALEVETVLSWVTLSHLGAQRVAQRAGLSLWGIVPASEIIVGVDGRSRYVCEALYGASLIPPDQARWPDDDRIPLHLRDLARRIRGLRGAAGQPVG